MSESNWGRWFSWVDKAGWPFAWILLIPIVTVGLQSGFLDDLLYQGHHCALVEEDPSGVGEDTWRCPREYVLPTLLPGLLNLVALCWLESRRPKVRWAALVAGTLGALRLAVPMMIYAASGAHVEIHDFGGAVYGPDSSVFASWSLWGLSLLCAFVLLVMFVGNLIGRLGDRLWGT